MMQRVAAPPPHPAPAAAGRRSAARSLGIAGAALAVPFSAHASFLPHEMMDSAAFYLAWFILIVLPIGGIVLFWMVHVMPEKIAHKRHHPQTEAIKTLCLLSLVFGGLLWPIAWLWAYVKPIGYQGAYGTDKHEDYFHAMGEKALAGQMRQHELDQLRAELDNIAAKGALTADLRLLRQQLATAQAAPEAPAAAAAATTVAGSV